MYAIQTTTPLAQYSLRRLFSIVGLFAVAFAADAVLKLGLVPRFVGFLACGCFVLALGRFWTEGEGPRAAESRGNGAAAAGAGGVAVASG